MDFSSRREQAIQNITQALQETLADDEVLIHIYRSQTKTTGLDCWIQTILPDIENAEEEVKKKGKEAWNPQGIGANMKDEHWELFMRVLHKEHIDFEEYITQTAPNLTTLCGYETVARLLDKTGGLQQLSKLTQRDCQCLGNESGVFGAKGKKSILEEHELASSDRALRILSSRVVLAARIDAYKGEFKGDKLHQEVMYAQ